MNCPKPRAGSSGLQGHLAPVGSCAQPCPWEGAMPPGKGDPHSVSPKLGLGKACACQPVPYISGRQNISNLRQIQETETLAQSPSNPLHRIGADDHGWLGDPDVASCPRALGPELQWLGRLMRPWILCVLRPPPTCTCLCCAPLHLSLLHGRTQAGIWVPPGITRPLRRPAGSSLHLCSTRAKPKCHLIPGRRTVPSGGGARAAQVTAQDRAWPTRTKGQEQHHGKKKHLIIWGKEEERCTAGRVGGQGAQPSEEVQVGTGQVSRSYVCRQRTQGRPWPTLGTAQGFRHVNEGSAELQQTGEASTTQPP